MGISSFPLEERNYHTSYRYLESTAYNLKNKTLPDSIEKLSDYNIDPNFVYNKTLKGSKFLLFIDNECIIFQSELQATIASTCESACLLVDCTYFVVSKPFVNF